MARLLSTLYALQTIIAAVGDCPKDNPGCSGNTVEVDAGIWRAYPDKYNQPGGNSGITTLTQLNSIIMGHAKTQIILAGSHLGLFEFLHKTPGQTKAAIEKATGLKRDDGSTRPIDVLLLGTTSLGLTILDKRDKTYRNCQIIEDLFESGGWHTIADLIDFEGIIKYKGEFHFVESLRQDTAVGLKEWPGTADNLYARFPDTPGSQKIFYDMMNSFTSMSIPCLSNHSVVIRGAKKMLDVGGGAGHGAIYLAKKFDKLKITLWDQHETVDIPRNLIAKAGLSDRIDLRAGSFLVSDFPRGYDAVLFSHQVVIWSKKVLLQIFKQAFDALTPGGGLVVFNSFANDDMDGPEWAGLDSVYFQAVPVSSGGYIWSMAQVEGFLRQVGFEAPARTNCNLWTPHAVLEVFKPLQCLDGSCRAAS